MSSGLDVYLESLGAKVSVSHNKPFPVNVKTKKQIPDVQVELYFLRVNAKGISWGKQQQIDDNIAVLYDVDNKCILRIEQL